MLKTFGNVVFQIGPECKKVTIVKIESKPEKFMNFHNFSLAYNCLMYNILE